ncbi:excalibur calcium-binding domain-containing protein [Arthrobacter sp. Br18]|uniref:excalibur calcium-binding domain-containing protein n=1 Tax=Arthrobacter sp. Br18 TaxID=1312954 RepID=UPI0004BCFD42|nr:excalibur calcium-binding domain-containing protein [Arthrobacter sp. Br18]
MKSSSIGLAAVAVAGVSLFSASPAWAVGLPFNNCGEAAAVGVFNIPAGTPGYQLKLDADRDGFGCDAAGTPPYDASIVARIIQENTPATTPPAVPTAVPTQMGEMPRGGAETGVAQTPEKDPTGVIALGGGLLLAALGGTYVVRRRSAAHS